MILGIGFLLLVSLVINAALARFQAYIAWILSVPAPVLHILNFMVSFGIFTLLFALMFKILPDAKMVWRDVWLGAAITSLLFTIGRVLIAQYLGSSTIRSSFGAAGSLVVILVWIYYSAQILFLGAEFTQVYTNRYGSRIVPGEIAIPLPQAVPAALPHPVHPFKRWPQRLKRHERIR
jgi:membrane protein